MYFIFILTFSYCCKLYHFFFFAFCKEVSVNIFETIYELLIISLGIILKGKFWSQRV